MEGLNFVLKSGNIQKTIEIQLNLKLIIVQKLHIIRAIWVY